MMPPTSIAMSLRPSSAEALTSRGTNTKCELLIMEQASTSASSSRAPMASERGVCQRPE